MNAYIYIYIYIYYVLHNDKKGKKSQSLFDEFLYNFNTYVILKF